MSRETKRDSFYRSLIKKKTFIHLWINAYTKEVNKRVYNDYLKCKYMKKLAHYYNSSKSIKKALHNCSYKFEYAQRIRLVNYVI
jgi:hypothetical protein